MISITDIRLTVLIAYKEAITNMRTETILTILGFFSVDKLGFSGYDTACCKCDGSCGLGVGFISRKA